MRPSLVVLDGYFETGSIARALEEERVIFETLGCIAVLAETLAFAVVVVVIDSPEPFAGAFDAEMIIGIHCQFTRTCGGLQQRLRHDDRCRYAVVGLVLESRSFPLLDVGQVCLVWLLCRCGKRKRHRGEKDSNSFHFEIFYANLRANLLLFSDICK